MPQIPVEPMPLWPGTHRDPGPGSVATVAIYQPADTLRTGAAIVICPGGGYGGTADHEAEPVARWLNSLGIAAVVLRYRHGPHHRHPIPLRDAQRAIRLARANAPDLRLDQTRIGILGFSAGGHLASTASTLFDEGDSAAADPVDRVSNRPDLSILLYPVITLKDPSAHAGSRTNLLGETPAPELVDLLSTHLRVTPRTPPTFLFHTATDQAVPVENALIYAAALRQAGVPFELHIYERGVHGVGLANGDPILGTWPGRCADWLKLHGF